MHEARDWLGGGNAMKRLASSAAIFAAALSFAPAVFGADETYKIGVPVGLTGYASLVDHAWRDGLLLAVKAVNARGGAAGRKLELVVEDNHSQPQDAVIA
jgi:branched-chain amino acid transport system substrate-binding protein